MDAKLHKILEAIDALEKIIVELKMEVHATEDPPIQESVLMQFIVYGEQVIIPTWTTEKLSHVVHGALKKSHNSSSMDWEASLVDGTVLDQEKTLIELGVWKLQTIFLNPRAGIGG